MQILRVRENYQMPNFYQPPSWQFYRESNRNNKREKYYPDDPVITNRVESEDSGDTSEFSELSEEIDDVYFKNVRPPKKNEDGLHLEKPETELP